MMQETKQLQQKTFTKLLLGYLLPTWFLNVGLLFGDKLKYNEVPEAFCFYTEVIEENTIVIYTLINKT